MTATQVREISSEVYMEHNKEIINSLIKIKPRMTTKEAVAYLKCDKRFLYKNLELFNGKVINLSNHYNFETAKLVEFKRKNLGNKKNLQL